MSEDRDYTEIDKRAYKKSPKGLKRPDVPPPPPPKGGSVGEGLFTNGWMQREQQRQIEKIRNKDKLKSRHEDLGRLYHESKIYIDGINYNNPILEKINNLHEEIERIQERTAQ